MGVTVREKVKGSGEWWVFANFRGKRRAYKTGADKEFAAAVPVRCVRRHKKWESI
jgi:integrase